ncbi:MAG TPA: Crp/Fnr family transcriptional regulator [Flavisolibacter sp.]|nr:Crp/Fnr family transcriptional regulator [Flavisolibacter sp.]
MEPLRQFLDFLNKFVPIEESEFTSIIQPRIQLRRFHKKEIITHAGEVEQYLNFVSKGLVRKYFRKEGGEIITQISMEDQIIHSQESFYSQAPSDYFVEAIEPTVLLSLNREALDQVFSASANMERMGRKIVTFVLVLTERWQMSLLKLSPRERFVAFVQNNPELLQRTPQKFLASLLNIQPETFSRFKHLLKER